MVSRQGWGWFDSEVLPWQVEVKQAIDRIEHLLVTNEFSDRVFDLRDGDTKTVRNLLAYRKVGVEGQTEELWVPPIKSSLSGSIRQSW
jgi:putative DNA primase/helicase